MITKKRFILPVLATVVMLVALACTAAPASPAPLPTPIPNTPSQPQPSDEIEMVEVIAPIESAEINIAESFPPQYFLNITSGLPNGCVKFNDYEVSRDGNDIKVTVTNMEPAPGQQIACTMMYGLKETNIGLGSDFDGGETYTVVINENVTETFVAQGTGEPASPNMVEAPAPVEDVQIRSTRSIPPQISLHVISRLPRGSSCSEFKGYEIERDGTTIKIVMTNLEVTEFNVPCTADLPVVETDIPLGSDFEGGVTYTVDVNGVTKTFVGGPNRSGQQPDETITRPAPIENVRIDWDDSSASEAHLVIESGLPNSCYALGPYSHSQSDNQVKVQIENIRPAATDIACAEIYRTVETAFQLDNIAPCDVLDVVINDESYTVQAIAPNVRCANPEPTKTPVAIEGPDGMKMVEVLAPVESVQILVTKSLPPQYTIQVISGLPSGCARFNDYEVSRNGNEIQVTITNLMPAPGQLIACTQIYGIHETDIPMGSDFAGGETYTVSVNGQIKETFTAQGTGQSGAINLDSKFQLGVGEIAAIPDEALEIAFREVTEDSRCPTNVTCIWAGQAKVLIDVATATENLGQHELTLEPGSSTAASVKAGDYTITLVDLAPYPADPGDIAESDYIATLAVSKD